MSGLFGLDRTLLWLAARVAGTWVRPTALPIDEAERLRGRGRRVLYILERRSLADLIALWLVCRAIGLPSPARPFTLGDARELSPVVYLARLRGLIRKRLDRHVPEGFVRIVRGGVLAGDIDI